MDRNEWPLGVIPFAWWAALPGAFLLGLAGLVFFTVPSALEPFASLLLFTLAGGLALLLLWLGARRLDRSVLGLAEGIGLRQGAVLGLGLAAFYAGMFVISRWKGLAHSGASAEEARALLGFGRSLAADLGVILAVTVFAPVAEELIFRGLVFRGLRDGLAAGGFMQRGGGGLLPDGAALGLALLASAAAFWSIHGGVGQDGLAAEYVFYGLLLALAYHLSGSLMVPMLMHSVTNTASVLEAARGAAVFSEPWLYWLVWAGPGLTLAVALLIRACVPRGETAGL